MTLNFGSLLWTLRVEQEKRSAKLNALRSAMVSGLLTGDEIRAAESRDRKCLHRSSGLQDVHNRQGSGFPHGVGQAEGSSPIWCPGKMSRWRARSNNRGRLR